MEVFNPALLKQLYIPPPASHKGQNGKLMVIGGSHLFHSASLWALTIASKIVDMVFYSSVPENNEIVRRAKEEFRDGIVVPREQIESYIEEADCVLIGPGMLRTDNSEFRIQNSEFTLRVKNLQDINSLKNEGLQAYFLTKYLLEKYPEKKWVIDAGALQMMEPEWLRQLNGDAIITPHKGEFERVFAQELKTTTQNSKVEFELAREMADKYNCIILLKGQQDIVCSAEKCVSVAGGNAGMTKGGTGDVLAGLVASLACKNDMFLAASAGSYINKKAGARLFEQAGFYFNASDLADEIPKVMHALLIQNQ